MGVEYLLDAARVRRFSKEFEGKITQTTNDMKETMKETMNDIKETMNDIRVEMNEYMRSGFEHFRLEIEKDILAEKQKEENVLVSVGDPGL